MREREESVSNRELLRSNVRQRPPRVFSRAETMKNRATLNRVWREGKWSAFVSLLFLSGLFEVVGKFDALMSPCSRIVRSRNSSCFSRIFKEIWKREYREMERRGKIFKFLYVLSMQYLEWWSLKGKQREIIKENYASMKETNEVEFMLCFVVKRDTNYFSSFKHRSSCSLALLYILNSSRNNCEDNARNCTHP